MVDIVTALEVRIDSYKRNIDRLKKQAFYDDECGYRESSQFNKGQYFALDYVVDDLNYILEKLKERGDQDA